MRFQAEHSNVSHAESFFPLNNLTAATTLIASTWLHDLIEKNCNANAGSVIDLMEGNIQGYRRGLIAKYGEATVLMLEAMKYQINKISDFEYRAMIDYYRKEVKRLKKEKQIK